MNNTDSATAPPKSDPGSARARWKSLSFAVPALVAVAFVAFALPPYLTLDPSRSRIPPPVDLPAYYPLLVAHVVFASIAILTAGMQIWTGLRRRYPALHRNIGRVYIFAGVLPASSFGFAIGSVSPFGPITRASNVLLAMLWLACTLIGYQMGRRRRYNEHRRWMIRSFALTLSIITNRVWAVIFASVLVPQLSTTFRGNEVFLGQTIAGLSAWLGWVIPLLIVEWWFVERMEKSQRSGEEKRQRSRTSQSQLRPDVGIS